jgi:predicted RNase H-like HicB family nuclease
MLTEYLEKAMAQAKVEKTEDGRYFASISQFKGVWGDGATPEESCEELRAGFEQWLVIALREDDTLPKIDGVSLNFGGKPIPTEP